MSEPTTITLGTLTLPPGLRWDDEYASWSPVAQSTSYGLTGALLVQEAAKQAGRPLTLVGGRKYCWITRADLDALVAVLYTPNATHTLTLRDGRRFTVTPRHDGDGPLSASPVPVVNDIGPSDPKPTTKYYIDALRFWILAELEP